MTTLETYPLPTRQAHPDSLASRLAANGEGLLAFPGVEATWAPRLRSVLAGRPWLQSWTDAVVAEVASWAREDRQQATGWFDQDLREVLAGEGEDQLGGQAPFALAGTVLTNLASLKALEADGLVLAGLRATGHSAGLLSAVAAAGADRAAVDAVRLALILGVTATSAARRTGAAVSAATALSALEGDVQCTPMAAVRGIRREVLVAALTPGVELAVSNTLDRHVLSGTASSLQRLREFFEGSNRAQATQQKLGQHPGAIVDVAWEPLLNTVPFHHSTLAPAVTQAVEWAAAEAISLTPALEVIDPATSEILAEDAVSAVSASILSSPQDWYGTLLSTVGPQTVIIGVGDNPAVHALTATAVAGTGAAVLRSEVVEDRRVLFGPGQEVARVDYAQYQPTREGTRILTKHTRLTGRSPFILAGMTPTTVDAGIVAAAANAGHVAELAGGGQVSERIFSERMAELGELLEPGHEVVFNALHLDPYLWDLHLGSKRLVQKARAQGAPLCGVTISAGIPERDEAVELLDQLNAAGMWLNALKPGNAKQVRAALDIAAATDHLLWLHVEGGQAGGHHSWEDLEELLLATYRQIREHDNVVLAVGGGVGSGQRAGELLSGRWSLKYGAPAMPVDAILLGTVTMACAESTASDSVKSMLAGVEGPRSGWVRRAEFEGGMTSGLSGLNADIFFVDNAASRTAALLDEVAGDAAAVEQRHDEIVAALATTAKPYFGDVSRMSYEQMLRRFAEIAAIGRRTRYQDGVWLDPSHRQRFLALLQRSEARLHPKDSGAVPTMFADSESVDDPQAAIDRLLAEYPQAAAPLHPADVDFFMVTCRQPGKPVPFVPVIDADVRRWYQSDALWQSHDAHYDADQVLIIPGPAAVGGIVEPDQPVADLMARFETQAASGLEQVPQVPNPLRDVLRAPTVDWAGQRRPNPLLLIASRDQWEIGDSAIWAEGDDYATLRRIDDDAVELELGWAPAGDGDGALRLRIDVVPVARGVDVRVTADSLAVAGRQALAIGQRPVEGAQDAHAALLGSSCVLPDASMRGMWPQVFETIGTTFAQGMLDLVHARHRIERDSAVTPRASEIGDAPGGLLLQTVAVADGFVSTDQFFIAQPASDGFPVEADAQSAATEWIDTPHLLLGELQVVAPSRLESFARISGDMNPIHRSDALGRFVGLPGRIVHGMWTSALGQRAVIEYACGGDAERLLAWEITFTAPVLPAAQVHVTVTRTGVADGNRRIEALIESGGTVVAVAVATVSPLRTAYIFPGQGIQHVGMGMDGYARSAAAKQVWDTADAHCRKALGFSILTVVRDNPTSLVAGEPGDPAARVTYRHPGGVLYLTQFTQVAMATMASAQVAELREQGVFDENAVTAGHSVGEYNALAAVTGTLKLEDLVELVFARGTAMHHLVPRAADGSSDFALAVVRPHLAGLDHRQTDALVASVAKDLGQLCEIVNHNLKGKQYAVAGTTATLAELQDRLGAGRNGKAPLLRVPGIDVPFHSRALRDGVPEFRAHLDHHLPETIEPSTLVGRYIPNLYPVPFEVSRQYVEAVQQVCDSTVLADLLATWDAHSVQEVTRTLLVELLAWQFAMPVRWIETTEVLCEELGIERIVEVGAGAQPTLTNLTKGALALPGHRGSRPVVLNVEADVDEVFEQVATPTPAPEEAQPEEPSSQAPAAQAVPVAAAPAVQDAPVTHEVALRALVAARAGVRPDQIADDSIEDLVDGASSRRNQLLMDIGKEFGVSGMDGAHEASLTQVAGVLAEKAAGYRFPGPVMAPLLDSELTSTVGRLGGARPAIADRVLGHWGLPAGWVNQIEIELALGARQGASKRSGDLTTLTGTSVNEIVDAAVSGAADRLGVTVAPASAAQGFASVDAAAVAEITDRFEDVLTEAAMSVLRGLDRLDSAPQPTIDEGSVQRLAQVDAEHGSGHAQAVAGIFDADRHVHLESSTLWAVADVDRLVQGAAAGHVDQARADQVALHRDADSRIRATLQWYRGRAAAFGNRADEVTDAIERVLSAPLPGIPVDLEPVLPHLPTAATGMPDLIEAAQRLTAAPGDFSEEVVLVTGASPSSIALSAVRHLLRGSATVVLVTSNDSEDRIAAYRDLERRYAGPGAQLHVIRANLASFADVDRLVEWMTTATMSSSAAGTRESKPALWPTLVLPFAASPAVGSMADTGPDNEVSLRLMLLGVQRLIGALGERIIAAGATPARVILPMSPNHGTFGGDGAYGDSKAALETVLNRWQAEQKAWGAGVRLAAVEIGWVKGTGLMAGNDGAAETIEQRLGIHAFTSDEMGTLIAAACTPQLAEFTEKPWRIDLTGGLSGVDGVAEALADIAGTQTRSEEREAAQDTVDALPNLPWRSAPEVFDVEPRIDLDDMVVIAGIAELGPWGGSATRWAAEIDSLSADTVTELAWRMGLITWDSETAGWTDTDGERVHEAEVFDLFAETVRRDAGVRELSVAGDVEANGTIVLTEVYLDKALSIGGVHYPAGTAIRVPATKPLQRQVGGQFPTGVDPTRHGLENSLALSMDPLAAWNLVVTAEALVGAGVTPEELSEAVHPSRIGNVQGTGMGGMNSLHKLYIDPVLGTEHANDLLQEALGNVVSAHVNQSLVGGYGPMVHPVAACATAAVSLEEAVDKIRVGKADILVAGGWDDLSSEGINGFADMSATADNAELLAKGIPAHAHSRPGDRRRAGFVESQGGGSFLVVRASTAAALGLPVRAVVVYAGSYGDGVQTSIPAPGLGALGAARGGVQSPLAQALELHGLTVDDIAVVSKHDTSTNANDPNEALIHATISEALGRTPGAPLRVVSQKSLTGHAKGGAAAWQLSGLCDILATGTVPGNRNLVSVDPQVAVGPLVVDYETLQRSEPVRAAVLTSLGFGHVSALVALAHPAVFLAALPESQRSEYQGRSRQRFMEGQRRLLATRYGGDPVFRRRTQRPEKQVEIDMLIGVDA